MIKKLLCLLILCAAAPALHAQQIKFECVVATSTDCNSTSDPGTGAQGVEIWRAGGYLNTMFGQVYRMFGSSSSFFTTGVLTAADVIGVAATGFSGDCTVSTSGVITCSIPLTHVTGILSCSDFPALTGAVTTSSGSCSTSLTGPSQINKTGSYTLVLGDVTGGIARMYFNCASACTLTIPANASVAYSVPTCIDIYADPSSSVVTIAITSDTLTLSPTNTTGSRSLAAGGIAKACKYASTKWNITGTGLT